MDFHSLSRRELQALCKKNKIPANITNVAMAEALQALKIVEYTEEFVKESQSGSTLSSVESLEMPEVTSPFPPPTASRSTRRTNVPKEALESANPTTRTRGTTRKTQFKDSNVIGTPALVAQTNRKKCQMASACKKMDSQFRECVDEGKKDILVTPAATSRRKRVEGSTVKRVYSTRQSARLAEKNNVMLNEIVNEEPHFSKKEPVAEEMNVKYGVEDFELSGITDIEEKSEDKDEREVVSNQAQEASVDKDVSKDVSGNEQDTRTGEEIELITHVEEEKYTNFENEGDSGENTVMLLNASNEVQPFDVCQDVCISETENTVQNNFKELKSEEASEAVENVNPESGEFQDVCISEIEAIIQKNTEELKGKESEASKDEAADLIENVLLETGDNIVVDDSPCDNAGIQDEGNEELDNDTTNGGSAKIEDLNVTSDKLIDLVMQQATKEVELDFTNHLDTPVQLKETEHNELEVVQVEENKKSADCDFIDHLGLPIQNNENEPNEIEVLQTEEITKPNDPVTSDESYADFSEQILGSGCEGLGAEHEETSEANKSENHSLEEKEKPADPSDESLANFSEQILGSGCEGLGAGHEETNEANKSEIHSLEEKEKTADPSDESLANISVLVVPTSDIYAETNHPVLQQACSTPCKSSVSMKIKSSTVSLDNNKENFGIEDKVVTIMKDTMVATKKVEDDAVKLQDMSVMKLRKMLKEKLKISEKSSMNGDGSEAPARLALRPISDNKLVDETHHS